MSCEAMQERLTARMSGELEAVELQELSSHLAGCASCAAAAALAEELWRGLGETSAGVPSARMRQRFAAVLAAELPAASRAPLTFSLRSRPRATRFAHRLLPLAAMLLLGVGVGYLTFGRQGGDIAELKREVGDLHEMVALSLLERGSVSERLQGVSYGRNFSAGDDKVTSALFARLLEDPNVNVRLAALEALRPLARREDRREELVAAVTRQDSPLVALSLIDLLLESGSTAARRDLEHLLVNPKLDPAVRGYLRDRLGRSA